MLFQSQEFALVFLPLVLIMYFVLAQVIAFRQWMLVVASMFFYGWWDIRFLPLMTSQALLSWLLLKMIGRRSVALYSVLGLNLSILFVFKYYDFFLVNLKEIINVGVAPISLILPIGVSFYTFHIISYAIDFKNLTAPQYPLRKFLLYIFYFPHLIAGPILRHNEIIEQFDTNPLRSGLADRLSRGFLLFTLGVAKKVLLADELASIADPLFTRASTQPLLPVDAWTAALAFYFQLYLDFSAYSDMAIGMALMMGYTLPVNFDAPYRATNIQEFWRRWHMTLSRFFRDYVYVPLGGSRNGEGRYVLAIIATMFLTGLWHGAGWTFVVWGGAHGVALLVYHYWSKSGLAISPAAGWIITMMFVLLGWVIFRSPNFATALSIINGMFFSGVVSPLQISPLLWIAALFSSVGPTNLQLASRVNLKNADLAVGTGILFAVCTLVVGGERPASFIYFQF